MKFKAAKPLPVTSALEQFEREHVKPKPGRTLIVGSHVYAGREDRRLRYPDALGVDMLAGPGVDMVMDLEEPMPEFGQFAHIECMSVLEHSRRPWLMAANLEKVLESGGTIYVTVPFCWPVHSYPQDFWRMTPEGLKSIFQGIEWAAIGLAEQHLTFGERLPRKLIDGFPHFPRCETVAFGRRA